MHRASCIVRRVYWAGVRAVHVYHAMFDAVRANKSGQHARHVIHHGNRTNPSGVIEVFELIPRLDSNQFLGYTCRTTRVRLEPVPRLHLQDHKG